MACKNKMEYPAQDVPEDEDKKNAHHENGYDGEAILGVVQVVHLHRVNVLECSYKKNKER